MSNFSLSTKDIEPSIPIHKMTLDQVKIAKSHLNSKLREYEEELRRRHFMINLET